MAVFASAFLAFAALAFQPSLRGSSLWRATVTPLASIMGCVFLVVAPLLQETVGHFALFAMAGLLCIAYLLGSVMRDNIRFTEPLLAEEAPAREPECLPCMHRRHETFRSATEFELEKRALHITERVSHGILAGAYFISVSYDLPLLAAFALRMAGQEDTIGPPRLIVSAILVGLGIVGTLAGLRSFERIEKYVVAVNLSMISALLVGLAWHNAALFAAGDWSLPSRGLTLPRFGRHRT